MKPVIVALVLLTASSAFALDAGITPMIGTNGFGAGADIRLAPAFGVRLVANTGSYSRNLHEEDIPYSGTLKFNNIGGLVDVYPTSGAFRISAGMFSNRNRIDLRSQDSGTITINGIAYPVILIGNVTGDVTFNKTSPYLGIGWGVAPGKRWGINLDAGAIFQGSPKLAVQAHPTIPSLVPASFYTNLERERANTENDIRNYKYWPVASVGLSFRF